MYVQTTNEALQEHIERLGCEKAPTSVHYLLLCRVIVSSDPMSEAAHWLKSPSAASSSSQSAKQPQSSEQKRTMKAAKVNRAEFVYPEYLMLCKLVRRIPVTKPKHASTADL